MYSYLTTYKRVEILQELLQEFAGVSKPTTKEKMVYESVFEKYTRELKNLIKITKNKQTR
jgi:hypothetical protein